MARSMLAYGDDSIWVLDTLQGEIIRVDPLTGHELSRIFIPGNLKDVATGDGGVWVLDAVAGTATPIDPSSNSAGAPIGVGPVRHHREPRLGVGQRRRGRHPVPHRPRTPPRDADLARYALGGLGDR